MPDQEWVPVSSRNIDAVSYDKDSQTLSVRFNSGRTYSYAGVQANLVTEMLQSPSVGRFFRENIRGAYQEEESW